jgi:glycosyltransferase involved in cell wall biosynthesis
LGDQIAVAARRPIAYLKCLAYAIARGECHPRKTLYFIIYFLEAVTAGRWMLSRGVSHFHSHYSTTVGMLITRLFPLTMSSSIHGSQEFIEPVTGLLREKIHASSFVRAISCFGRSQMTQLVPYELWDRFEVVPLGIDTSVYQPAPFRTSPDPFEVSCVGSLSPVKGHHILIQSIATLRSGGRNVRLRLVGDGPERASLERHVDRLGLSEHVVFEGSKNQTDVIDLYRRADCFALASSAEGLPVVLMEAMAMEIPCIATRITGIPELIRDGADGLLVTPSDIGEMTAAIKKLMDDPALRKRLAEAGRARVRERYDLQTNVQRLSDVFLRRLYGIRQDQRSFAGSSSYGRVEERRGC